MWCGAWCVLYYCNQLHSDHMMMVYQYIYYTGITVIETDVEGKNVVVTHDDSVSQDSILDKLQKVCV